MAEEIINEPFVRGTDEKSEEKNRLILTKYQLPLLSRWSGVNSYITSVLNEEYYCYSKAETRDIGTNLTKINRLLKKLLINFNELADTTEQSFVKMRADVIKLGYDQTQTLAIIRNKYETQTRADIQALEVNTNSKINYESAALEGKLRAEINTLLDSKAAEILRTSGEEIFKLKNGFSRRLEDFAKENNQETEKLRHEIEHKMAENSRNILAEFRRKLTEIDTQINDSLITSGEEIRREINMCKFDCAKKHTEFVVNNSADYAALRDEVAALRAELETKKIAEIADLRGIIDILSFVNLGVVLFLLFLFVPF